MRYFPAILCMLMLGAVAGAAPSISGPFPESNSFVKGGNINFSVNITGTGLSTATLFVISKNAYQQGENWDISAMQCSNSTESEWRCSRMISFAIAGSDTPELFYFEANDTTGGGSLGSAQIPIPFTLDRNPPSMSFAQPQNYSYVSGSVTVRIAASDTASGVNASTMQFSLDNATWNNLTDSMGTWNSLSYANNATVRIYARARDNVGNPAESSIDVFVDNEIPQMSVVSPANGSAIAGSAEFRINASDSFSGVGLSRLRFVNDADFSMPCAGSGNYSCSTTIDTSFYADNTYNITFTVFDMAGNSVSANISITLKNSRPVVSVLLANGTLMKGVVTVGVSITRPEGIVTNVSLSVDSGASSAMSCSGDYTSCSSLLDTKNFADGPHTLTATAGNTLGYSLKGSAGVNVDNTKPVISVSAPNSVRGAFDISASVSDENPKIDGVTLKIESTVKGMSCTAQGKTLNCLYRYESSYHADGIKTLEITAVDNLGQTSTSSKNISFDNSPPGFVFMKIEPIQASSTSEFRFTAGLNETGSAVTDVNVTIRHAEMSATVKLVNAAGVWFGKAVFGGLGGYDVGLKAEDANGNSATYESKGYFHIGNISCGDGICQPGENYCMCQTDCYAPTCSGEKVIECGSGIPLCSSTPTCGDRICTSKESCSSCESDCGSCESIEAAEKSIDEAKKAEEAKKSAGKQETAPAGFQITQLFSQIFSIFALQPLAIVVAVLMAAVAIILAANRLKGRKEAEPF